VTKASDPADRVPAPRLTDRLTTARSGLPTWLYWLSLALTFGAAALARLKHDGPILGPLSASYLVKTFQLGGVSEASALEVVRNLVTQQTETPNAEVLFDYQTVAAHPVYPLLGAPFARLFGAWGLQALTLVAAVVLAAAVAKVAANRFGNGIALGVMTLGLVGSGWLSVALAVGPDSLAALLAAIAVATVWHERTHRSRKLLWLAGACAFLACLTAPMVGVAIGALAACYLASALRWRSWRVDWWRGLVATLGGAAAAHLLQLMLWPSSGVLNQLQAATDTSDSQMIGAMPHLAAAMVKEQYTNLVHKPGAGPVLAVVCLAGLVFCWRSLEARLVAGAIVGTQVYAGLAGEVSQGPWVLALVPVLWLVGRLAVQLRSAPRSTAAFWSVIGGSFVFQLVVAAQTFRMFVPDSRHYYAMALRFGGLSRDRVAEILCGPEQHWSCLPIERLLDWDLVRPRFVYPALATPFVKLWGEFGLAIISVVGAAACFAVAGWYLTRRFGRPVALLAVLLGIACGQWFFFLVMMTTESLSALWSALMLVAVWLYCRHQRRRYLVWLAVLVILSTFTRQAVLVPAMAFGLAWVGQCLVTRRWRNPFTAPGVLVAGLGLVMQTIQLSIWPDVADDSLVKSHADGLVARLSNFVLTARNVTFTEVGRAAIVERSLLVLGVLALVAIVVYWRQVESQLALGGLLAGWLYLVVNAAPTTGLRYFEPALVFMLAAVAGLLRPVAWPDAATKQVDRLVDRV